MLLLMLKNWRNWKGAGKFELEMRNACHLSCSQLPFKGNSHALFSTSASSAQQSRPKTTWHQSPGKTWGQDGHHLCPGPVSFLDLLWDPAQSPPAAWTVRSGLWAAVSWTTMQVQQRRLFEEPGEEGTRARDRKGESMRNGKQAACGSI